jgi:hypothetical protein
MAEIKNIEGEEYNRCQEEWTKEPSEPTNHGGEHQNELDCSGYRYSYWSLFFDFTHFFLKLGAGGSMRT